MPVRAHGLRALRLAPDEARVHLRLARALNASGQGAEALGRARHAVALGRGVDRLDALMVLAAIQTDRGHRVVTTGPYRIVRHPGYVAAILGALAGPLMFGSVWSFIPAGLIIILFIWRTALEDRTLQKELDGYMQYTQKTRYRLMPLLW